jgi:hypothetical protein
MGKDASHRRALVSRGGTQQADDLPTPSMQFRRQAWLAFQRSLDPLAAPKRLPMKRQPR